jgi:hypothetical protein
MGPPQRSLPPGKPEQVTQTASSGWSGTCLRQWHLCLTRVPLCAGPAQTVSEQL